MRSSLIFIFLYSVCITSNLSANSDTLLIGRKADSLFAIGDYYQSGLYYYKASYFSLSETNRNKLLLKYAICLKQQSRFEEVDALLSGINYLQLSDSDTYRFKYELALCSYLAENNERALLHLNQMGYWIRDSNLIASTLLLKTLVHNELFQWHEAKQTLKCYIRLNPDLSRVKKGLFITYVDSLYAPNNIPKLKNPNKAVRFSTFLPGLGQAYAGYYGEAGTAFICNVGFLGATAVCIYFKYYATGLFAANGLFARFYTGNLKRAEFLTNKRNYLRSKNFNEKQKHFILENLYK